MKLKDITGTLKLQSFSQTVLPHNEDRPQLRRKTTSGRNGQTELPTTPQGSRPVIDVREHRQWLAQIGDALEQQLRNEGNPTS